MATRGVEAASIGLVAAVVLAVLATAAAPPSIRGSLSVEPPAIPPPTGAPPPAEAAACLAARTEGECLTPCAWAAPSTAGAGVCVHPSLLEWMDRLSSRPAAVIPVRVVVEDVAAQAPFDAALFLGNGSAPALVLPFPADARRVVLPTHSRLFSPSRTALRVCLNATPCPAWAPGCASCVAGWAAAAAQSPEPGADRLPPVVRLRSPLSPEPSWSLEGLRSVEARLLVTETGSPWSLGCTLRHRDRGPVVEACAAGGPTSPPCEDHPPTVGEGAELDIILTGDAAAPWREGRYELWCAATDAAGNVGSLAEVFELAAAGGGAADRVPPRCGDGVCEAGEGRIACCVDCGCPADRACVEGMCVRQDAPGLGTALALAALALLALRCLGRRDQGQTPRSVWASTSRDSAST